MLTIEPISERQVYADLILNIHYAKRWPSVSHAFGVYEGSKLLGVICYGSPPSATLKAGIAGKEYSPYVLELNRLVLYDNRPNLASFLIGGSLRGLKKKVGNAIIVSFADTSQGHLGKVYQATNFLYTGLSAKRTDWKVKGKEHLHGQTISDEFRGQPNRSKLMREKYGDDFYLEDRPRKHRYITVIGSHSFKKAAKQALKYKTLPYPS